MKKLINLNLTGAVALLVCLFVNSAVADHDVTTPSATITPPANSTVQRGSDVKFTASLSEDLAHSVLVLVNWTAPGITTNPRYWWVNNSDFKFSFPCNLANRGQHTITIQETNSDTNTATYNAHLSQSGTSSSSIPTAYNVGSPSSATSTCN